MENGLGPKGICDVGNESLWEVASHRDHLFKTASIPHSICRGVAVCLHGYQRNTTDVDIIISRSNVERVRELLTEALYAWMKRAKSFAVQAESQFSS